MADRGHHRPTPAHQASSRRAGFQLVPVSIAAANAFVAHHHRHPGRVQGATFALGATLGAQLAGVVVVGRPVARGLDDTGTLEFRRRCTTGAPNPCSFLPGAARRATRALGYRRLVTYALASEPGASLRAAGWRPTAQVPPRSWSCPSRPRTDRDPLVTRRRWEVPA